jgi:2,4-dienoyl-CoA reductase-like NADH-dependent reductase (Old Yellow Enzyme family)
MQFKITAVDYNDDLFPWQSKGTTIEDSIQVCKWLEEAGVDGFHVSSGSTFPHPRNPAGEFPIKDTIRGYDTMISSGRHTWRNYLMFRTPVVNTLFKRQWEKAAKKATDGRIEGINLHDARRIKEAVSVPVVCTGGFQTRSAVEGAIERGDCDGVTIGRPLIANNDLVKLWAEGHDRPPNPCKYTNKCLINQVENPLGCYEPSRYASHEDMVKDIMSVYDPPPFVESGVRV